MKVKLDFNIVEIDSETEVKWKASVNFGFLTKFFGENLIRKISNDIAEQIIKCIKDKIT